jgi:hypothetical protein
MNKLQELEAILTELTTSKAFPGGAEYTIQKYFKPQDGMTQYRLRIFPLAEFDADTLDAAIDAAMETLQAQLDEKHRLEAEETAAPAPVPQPPVDQTNQ